MNARDRVETITIRRMKVVKTTKMLRRGKETWAEGERRVKLTLWRFDGAPSGIDESGQHTFGNVDLPEINVGRTDGRTRLGFMFKAHSGKRIADFTLSRGQVKALREFCDYQLRRMKKKAAK